MSTPAQDGELENVTLSDIAYTRPTCTISRTGERKQR